MKLQELIQKKILILDGAMGTKVGTHTLSDLLNLTGPERIEDIHHQYLRAGADIIKTNTFNANALSLEKYKAHDKAKEINFSAVKIARNAIRPYEEKKPRFIAGVIGPSPVSASSLRGFTPVSQEKLITVFFEQALALAESGVDLFLIETVYDLQNAEAAFKAIQLLDQKFGAIPVMVSATLSPHGKLLSGENIDQFIEKISPYKPFSLGLNCSYGSLQMNRYLRELSDKAPFWVSAHPNAGLPDKLGKHPEDVQIFSRHMKNLIEQKWVNIVGGCCGTDETHIEALYNLTQEIKDFRRLEDIDHTPRFS